MKVSKYEIARVGTFNIYVSTSLQAIQCLKRWQPMNGHGERQQSSAGSDLDNIHAWWRIFRLLVRNISRLHNTLRPHLFRLAYASIIHLCCFSPCVPHSNGLPIELQIHRVSYWVCSTGILPGRIFKNVVSRWLP
mmetsp:Transcript_14414/g.32813  ORF Transcript_14414/g.32813 Transcript_14414/m.32813 type:complete len:135 (-) Transcript_14414:119-523(-)